MTREVEGRIGLCPVIYDSCLLLRLKFCGVRLIVSCLMLQSVRGASHQLAFMSNFQTIINTFYSPIYPVDEEMGTWGGSSLV